ncbi:hypothetical protein CAL7102_07727 [Dulcicalothrix desertica PCC 7102]|nr:hypothetical protein CAL7102_07727 [Dulcicalothrix desertica PCC 7102]
MPYMEKTGSNNRIKSRQAIIRYNALLITVSSLGLFLTGCGGTNALYPGASNQPILKKVYT